MRLYLSHTAGVEVDPEDFGFDTEDDLIMAVETHDFDTLTLIWEVFGDDFASLADDFEVYAGI